MKESEGIESEYDEAMDGMEVDELQSEGEKVRTLNADTRAAAIAPNCAFSRLLGSP